MSRYMRRCVVRPMYLSASAVALSTWVRYDKCLTFTFTFIKSYTGPLAFLPFNFHSMNVTVHL